MVIVIKKAKGAKKCVRKRIFKFNYYKNSILNNEIILKSQRRFKNKARKVYTKEINKIALSSNDGKILQTFDRIILYPYSTSTRKVCKTELISYVNIKWLIYLMLLVKIKQNIIQSGVIFQIIHLEY